MKTCPRCGFANLDSRDTCLKCKARLGHHAPLSDLSARERRFDLSSTQRRIVGLWHSSTDWMKPRLPADLPHRRPATAATLSILPGLGQLYNHQWLKALWFVLGWAVGLWVSLMTIRDSYSNAILAAWLGVWIWGMTDALVTAIRINGQSWTGRKTFAMFLYLVCMVCFVVFVGLFIVSPFVYFRYIGQDHFAPVIARGDIIWLDKLCLKFGGTPRRGELMYYNPAAFGLWQGNNLFLYDAQNFIERVIGLPGEEVIVNNEDGVCEITVNGQPLPREYYPLCTTYLPPHREYRVPPGHWLILQTQVMQEELVQFAAGVNPGRELSGIDMEPEHLWTNSCYVPLDDMIGRVMAISSPPTRRRWFPRPESDPLR